MKKLMIVGSKVRRIDDAPRGIRQYLTVRNAIGLAGILAFAAWMFNLLGGR